MKADGAFREVKRGGFISPFGYECINTDGAAYGSVTGCRTFAMKRHIGDEYIAKAAVEVTLNIRSVLILYECVPTLMMS